MRRSQSRDALPVAVSTDRMELFGLGGKVSSVKKARFYDIITKPEINYDPMLFKSKTPRIQRQDLDSLYNIPGLSRDASLLYFKFMEDVGKNQQSKRTLLPALYLKEEGRITKDVMQYRRSL